ncbi:hypothetical protein BGX26_006844, partial [Mortierella sp. AD094]
YEHLFGFHVTTYATTAIGGVVQIKQPDLLQDMSKEEPITEDYASPFTRLTLGPQWRKDKNDAQLLKFLDHIHKVIESGPL